MKIVYCISGTHNSGGMERVLANKANYLVSKGFDITIITTDQRGLNSYFLLDQKIKHIDLSINYEENNGKSIVNKIINYPWKQLRHRRKLTVVLNEIQPDVTVSMFCNDAAFLYKIKDGSKKVLEIHFCRFKRLQYNRKGLWGIIDKFRSWHDAKIVSRYDRFVTLTNEDKKYWGNLDNSVVIPNSQTFVCDAPSRLNANVVLAVGRYTYQKGFDMLLDAWALVCKHIDNWTLRIVGDGELWEAHQRQVNELGIANRVQMIHATKNIIEEYHSASMLVMSSRYEGFGMVLLEAQSAGLPTISFDCKCGPSEIISDGRSGYLVPVNDVENLSKRIIELIENPELRIQMGRCSYEDSSRFSEEAVMGKWEDLFNDIIG